jgi:pyridoxine 5-phosphate synthase
MRLYVNIDHVATIRQARRTDEPDPVRAAILAELGGAEGITVHLREDRRHIQDHDLRRLLEMARTPVNLEVAAEPAMVEIAVQATPTQVTLVPERREEVTTEGGLDLSSPDTLQRVQEASGRLQEAGIRVSLFVDPDVPTVEVITHLGVEAVEFHTGEYANARGGSRGDQLTRVHEAARWARAAGLAVHAGHGLTYENILPIAALPEIEEVNIGHSIVSRAVLVGMERAVGEMRDRLREAPLRIREPGHWVAPLGY